MHRVPGAALRHGSFSVVPARNCPELGKSPQAAPANLLNAAGNLRRQNLPVRIRAMTDIKKFCFLRDEQSQIHALADALSSANVRAISEAFDAVARTRGLAQIARDSGVSLDDLHNALADPARPDIGFLENVLELLAIGCPP